MELVQMFWIWEKCLPPIGSWTTFPSLFVDTQVIVWTMLTELHFEGLSVWKFCKHYPVAHHVVGCHNIHVLLHTLIQWSFLMFSAHQTLISSIWVFSSRVLCYVVCSMLFLQPWLVLHCKLNESVFVFGFITTCGCSVEKIKLTLFVVT
jgi:hypothetical protein